MIESLHIRKFLGIDKLTIDKLNKVNIIGGKPGSGKTKVLKYINNSYQYRLGQYRIWTYNRFYNTNQFYNDSHQNIEKLSQYFDQKIIPGVTNLFLIDAIDAGIHPDYYGLLIDSFPVDENSQLFITTYCREFIRVANSILRNDIAYIRLENDNGCFAAYEYDSQDLEYSFDMSWDI